METKIAMSLLLCSIFLTGSCGQSLPSWLDWREKNSGKDISDDQSAQASKCGTSLPLAYLGTLSSSDTRAPLGGVNAPSALYGDETKRPYYVMGPGEEIHFMFPENHGTGVLSFSLAALVEGDSTSNLSVPPLKAAFAAVQADESLADLPAFEPGAVKAASALETFKDTKKLPVAFQGSKDLAIGLGVSAIIARRLDSEKAFLAVHSVRFTSDAECHCRDLTNPAQGEGEGATGGTWYTGQHYGKQYLAMEEEPIRFTMTEDGSLHLTAHQMISDQEKPTALSFKIKGHGGETLAAFDTTSDDSIHLLEPLTDEADTPQIMGPSRTAYVIKVPVQKKASPLEMQRSSGSPYRSLLLTNMRFCPAN